MCDQGPGTGRSGFAVDERMPHQPLHKPLLVNAILWIGADASGFQRVFWNRYAKCFQRSPTAQTLDNRRTGQPPVPASYKIEWDGWERAWQRQVNYMVPIENLVYCPYVNGICWTCIAVEDIPMRQAGRFPAQWSLD